MARRQRMFWQLALPYIVVIIVSLIAITWFSFEALSGVYVEQTALDLESRANLIKQELIHRLSRGEGAFAGIDSLCKELGRTSHTRITVMLPDGRVVGDSDEDPLVMENHATRQEMAAALSDSVGRSNRFSSTVKKNLAYVAVPMYHQGSLIGVVRTSVSVATINRAIDSILFRVSLVGLGIAAIAALISLFISRRISRPLVELKLGAEHFAKGDLKTRLPVVGSAEIASLAEAMNSMATQLYDRISTIMVQRNEQEAMFASMIEGVIALDTAERILNMNEAAGRLLRVAPDEAKGKSVAEVVNNLDLLNLVRKTITTRESVEEEVVLHEVGERFIQVNGTMLLDPNGQSIGALIVLNDLTSLRRLENVRRDFVANVSHELKTPITSIKGFVETLLGGALQVPGDAERFLNIIGKQADRLSAIIDDLLSLSRIEQEAGDSVVELEEVRMKGILQSAIQICHPKAQDKRILIELVCPDGLHAHINQQLLEQAVVNLVDNAIKYSNEDSPVRVTAEEDAVSIRIAVTDQGIGIKEKHLPRVFERFYRVDKARSRAMGGTGLGLAIVKHIVIAHKGTVTVASEPGIGSTFTIVLPKDPTKLSATKPKLKSDTK